MSIGKESRYNYAVRIRRTNGAGVLIEHERFDLRPTLTRTDFNDNVEYVPLDGDSWSRVSWKTLGNGRYWWIIADYSQVVDPFSELFPQTKTRYVTQLIVDLPVGTTTEITVGRPKDIQRGMRLRVEDLNPANPVSVEMYVLGVNNDTGVVTISPVDVPVGGIPALLSRVSELYEKKPVLQVPTISRALFQALDFDNPLNILVE